MLERRTSRIAFRTFPPVRTLILPFAVAGIVALSACSGGATAATTGAAQIATSASAPAATAASSAAAQIGTKVNANTATVAQIQAALEAAGVPNAARWAREVDEYRPYPTDDPTFAKLRQNLAKYNPDAQTVDKIVSALALS